MVARALYTGLLASLLLLQATAWWAFLQLRETSRERYVATRLEKGVEDLVVEVLRIPKSWENDSHPGFQHVERGEIRYQGRMYDIFRVEERGDTILYHGIYDHEETELFKGTALECYFELQSGTHSNQGTKLFKDAPSSGLTRNSRQIRDELSGSMICFIEKKFVLSLRCFGEDAKPAGSLKSLSAAPGHSVPGWFPYSGRFCIQ